MSFGKKVAQRLIRHVLYAFCLICASGILAADNADVSGKWMFLLTMGEFSAEYPADLQTEGERVSGTMAGQKLEGTYKDGELALNFTFHPPEAPAPDTLTLTARFDGEALAGEFTFGQYAGAVAATRRP